MAISIGPNTGENHIGFTHDERTFVVDDALGPELARYAAGTAPDPSLIDPGTFVAGDTRLHVTRIEPSGDGFVACVDGIPSGLTLTRTEVATLASAIPAGRAGSAGG